MPTHYINGMLDLPELNVIHIQHIGTDELHIHAEPLTEKQSCPCCDSKEQLIRKGIRGLRRVRHLSAFEKKTYLLLHALRMKCTRCDLLFVWDYGLSVPNSATAFLFVSLL